MTTAPWDLPPHSWGQRLEKNETVSCEAPCMPRAPQTATDAPCQLSKEHKLLEGRDHWVWLVLGAPHRAGHIVGPQSTYDERRKSLPHETEKKLRPREATALPRATQPGRGGDGDQDPDSQLPGPGRHRAGLDSTQSPSSSCAHLSASAG